MLGVCLLGMGDTWGGGGEGEEEEEEIAFKTR